MFIVLQPNLILNLHWILHDQCLDEEHCSSLSWMCTRLRHIGMQNSKCELSYVWKCFITLVALIWFFSGRNWLIWFKWTLFQTSIGIQSTSLYFLKPKYVLAFPFARWCPSVSYYYVQACMKILYHIGCIDMGFLQYKSIHMGFSSIEIDWTVLIQILIVVQRTIIWPIYFGRMTI